MRRELWMCGLVTAIGCGGPAEPMVPAGAEQCATGRASAEVSVCDGQIQCEDGSDELGCRAPAQFSTLEIRRVALDGLSEDGRIEVHHRLRLTLALDAETLSPGLLTVAFGLVDANISNPAQDTQHCTLGGATFLSAEMEAQRMLQIEATVPAECLGDDAGQTEKALWVGIDPSDEATMADGSSATRTYVFDTHNAQDNQACLGPDETAGCVTQLWVGPSQGVDLAFDELELGSNVAILYPQELPLHWKPYPDGSPMPQFRPPLIIANTALHVVGADPSTENVLADPSDELWMHFELRPLVVYEDETAEPDLQWQALQVDQASRASPVGHPERARIEALPADGRSIHTFDLYAEGEVYELLREGGAWADYGVFELRSCLRPNFDEHRLDEVPPEDNNCQVQELILANGRTPNNSATTSAVRYGFGPWTDAWGSTSTEQLRLDLSFGNKISAAGIATDNVLSARLRGWVDYDIFSAKWAAQANGLIAGSYYDAEFIVFDQTLVNRGQTSSGGALTVNTSAWTDQSWMDRECESWSYYYLVTITLRGCATGRLGIDYDGTYDVRQTFRGYGAAMRSEGDIGVHVRPFADAQLSVTASVDAGAVRAGVSANITVVDLQLNDFANSNAGAGPLSTMAFTVTDSPRVYSNRYLTDIDAQLNLNTLRGSIWVYVDYLDAWESLWGWEREWSRWGSKTIASWPGLDASFDVLHRASVSTRSVNARSDYNIAESRL